jgi:hypothetical protein
MFSEVSVILWLWGGRTYGAIAWQKKTTHLMIARKQRERKRLRS